LFNLFCLDLSTVIVVNIFKCNECDEFTTKRQRKNECYREDDNDDATAAVSATAAAQLLAVVKFDLFHRLRSSPLFHPGAPVS